jgi:hypothetical protein
VAAPVAAEAQTMSFAIKGGLTRSTVSHEGLTSFDPKAENGMSLGAAGGVDLGHTVRFQPELMLSNRKFKSLAGSTTVHVESRTIDVPLLLTAHATTGGRIQPMIYAGPQLNFLSKATQTVGATTTDLKDQFRTVDVNLTVGGGVEIGAGRGAVTLEGRASLGLRDLSVDTTNTLKTRAVLVLAGYRF